MKPVPFYTRWSLLILTLVVFCMPGVFGGAIRALRTNRNEVKEWLPAQYNETRDFNWFLKHFAGGQFVLLSWEGCTLDDPRLPLLAEKLVPSPGVKRPENEPRYFARVVTGRSVLEDLMASPNNLPRQEAMARLHQALIGPDGQHTCALLTLTEEGEQNQRKTLEHILQVATKECAIPESAIRMGGPPVDNVELDKAGENSLMRLAVVTGVVGVFISWWCLRSFKLMLMVFFAGVYSAAASLAVVWYTGAQMNSILLTMPSLVYVAAISGAIHLANYYREAVHENGVYGASMQAVKHAWLPLTLASITTAFGLFSLAISELVPIQMFGVYSAIGVLVATIVLFFYMPAVLDRFPVQPLEAARHHERTAASEALTSDWWRKVGEAILRHNLLVSAVCFAVLATAAWGIQYSRTSVKLLNFFQKSSDIRQSYIWLEGKLGPLIPMEVVLRFNKHDCPLNMADKIALLRVVQAKVVELPDVGSALSGATFSPKPPAPPKLGGLGRVIVRDANRTQKDVYNRRLEKHRLEFQYNGYMNEDREEEVWRISARVSAVKDIDYGLFVDEIRKQVEPVLNQLATTGIKGIGDGPTPGVTATYTGLVPLVDKSQRTLLENLIQGFGMDLALIVTVLIIAVQDVGAGLLLLLPSVFPGLIVFGLMGWCGVVVDVGTVMPPAVALGVTVDDVVHFLLWFRRGIAQGMTRKEAVMLAYKDCARPMFQSWVVIGLGLSVFSLSPFTPTQRFGFLMGSLLTVALAGNLLFLPALLAGPLGFFFSPLQQIRNRRAALARARQPEVPAFEPSAKPATAHSGIGAVATPHLQARENRGERLLRTDTPHRQIHR